MEMLKFLVMKNIWGLIILYISVAALSITSSLWGYVLSTVVDAAINGINEVLLWVYLVGSTVITVMSRWVTTSVGIQMSTLISEIVIRKEWDRGCDLSHLNAKVKYAHQLPTVLIMDVPDALTMVISITTLVVSLLAVNSTIAVIGAISVVFGVLMSVMTAKWLSVITQRQYEITRQEMDILASESSNDLTRWLAEQADNSRGLLKIDIVQMITQTPTIYIGLAIALMFTHPTAADVTLMITVFFQLSSQVDRFSIIQRSITIARLTIKNIE